MSASTARSIRTTLGPAEQDRVGSVLQPVLVDLVDLSLSAKQAHWTVVGPEFRSVHLQLDEIVDSTRAAVDQVAERLAIVGLVPDGRSSTVATTTEVPALDKDWLRVERTVASVADAVQAVASHTRRAITDLDGADPVTEDLLIAVLTQLEEHLWMLNAQER
ncbi:MAG: Dps family protein [Acidimicrobiales bacterium]